jgi:hypothetical protein
MPNVTSISLWRRIDGALVRTAARRAGDIRNGIAASIDPVKVAEQFLNDFHEGTEVSPQFARSWARLHIKPDNTQLAKALERTWAEGYVLGQVAGFAAIGKARLRKDAATDKAIADALAVDWSTWTPGNVAAALVAHPRGGFARILDKRVSTLTNLDATSLDRIGTQLSDALLEGLAPADLAKRIIADVENVITSPSRALTIATTEMNSAMSIASMDTYRENGVEQVEWIGLEACDYCQDNIDASPLPVGEEFPTGDTEPPGHANCRCSIAPFIDWEAINADEPSMIELALKPELKREPSTGVPGPLEAERALSRLAILPNPDDPALPEPEKYVESPWQIIDVPTVNPNLWDKAEKVLVDLNDLYGTDPYLKRKRVRKHIEAMGQALTEYRSYPLVVEKNGDNIILDGHHRLMSVWLLGQETAAVWKVKI